MIATNGVNANTQMPRAAGISGLGGIAFPLVMAAPSLALFPLVSGMGAGRIFGSNYKWRYRYKNSTTGDVSGPSQVAPWEINLGMETTPGSDSWIGQSASFLIATTSSDVPIYCDAIQLFRSASGAPERFYLVDEKRINGASSLLFVDNNPDDDIVANDTLGLQPNPSFEEGGAIPPMVKVFPHTAGEVWLYGMHRMGPYRTGTVSVTVGSSVVTRTDTSTMFEPSRVGQSFRLRTYTGSTIDDPTVYRIVDVRFSSATGSTLVVTPDIQVSTLLTTEGATYTSVSYEIIDDRDGRLVLPSEPGNPTSYDLLNAFGIGFDRDDDLLHIFTLRGITYGQTRRGLFRLLGDVSVNASDTLAIEQISTEGTTGFNSGCLTPSGWVYLHETLGVRVFDGAAPPLGYETIGTTTPSRALGQSDENGVFLPYDQFYGRDDDAYSSLHGMSRTGFEPSMLAQAHVCYDPQTHVTHVFYVPNGKWSLREEIAWDHDAQTWRGPWRRSACASGLMRNPGGTEVFLFGDDSGDLWLDDQQNVDLIQNGTGAAAATTSSTAGYVLVDSTTPFDGTTFKQQGAPVVLYAPTGGSTTTMQVVPVVTVIDVQTLVLEEPAIESGNLYTYRPGGIRWFLQTAWINLDVPVNPKAFEELELGVKRASSGASTAVSAALIDGDETLANATGENGVVGSIDANGVAHVYDRTMCGSRTFTKLLYGTATTGDPQITQVLARIRVDEGA